MFFWERGIFGGVSPNHVFLRFPSSFQGCRCKVTRKKRIQYFTFQHITTTRQTYAFCSYRCFICVEKHNQTLVFLFKCQRRCPTMASQKDQKSQVKPKRKACFAFISSQILSFFTWTKKRNACLFLSYSINITWIAREKLES